MQLGNILVTINVAGKPVRTVNHEGRWYIEGRPGSDYSIKITNQGFQRVLAVPSVDGLSVIDGKPAGSNSQGFIIEGHGSMDIPGWMVDKTTAAKFTFGDVNQSYNASRTAAGKDSAPGSVGLIGVMIFEEMPVHRTHQSTIGFPNRTDWPAYPGVPVDTLPYRPRDYGNTGSPTDMWRTITTYASAQSSTDVRTTLSTEPSVGTVFGEATDFKTTTGQFKRGNLNCTIVIEYDTLRNLNTRGVPTNELSARSPFQRSPFPMDTHCEPPAGWGH